MILLMDLPKPIHGMSTVNAQFRQYVANSGTSPVVVINTVPSYMARFFGTKVWPVVKLLHTTAVLLWLFVVLVTFKHKLVYRPIYGGTGQIFDVLYLGLARLFRRQLYIHHHSFAYLNKPSKLFKLLLSITGNSATHIVLGERMAQRLCDTYPMKPAQVVVLSNAAFFNTAIADNAVITDNNASATRATDISKEQTPSRSRIRLGYLSNISIDKGIDSFVDVCRQLKDRRIDFTAAIAGPFAGSDAEAVVREACATMPEVSYCGPVYGKQKNHYFAELDCFVFPSKYANEAEPLVLYEAGQYGVFTVGSNKGCMPDALGQLGGFTAQADENLVPAITGRIIAAKDNNEFEEQARASRVKMFSQLQSTHQQQLKKLLARMVSIENTAT